MNMKEILFLLTMVVFASAKSQDTCITDARTYTNTNIIQNGVRAITAQKLNTSLNKIIDAIECVEGGVFVSTDSNTVINYDVLNSQNTPPGSPATGDIYLVGNSPSGAWVGHAKDIAEWNGSAWVFTDGVQGDFLYNATNALTYIFRSGNWVQTTGIPALNNGNTISSGLTIGTNNARSLNFETNNINRGRFDSIGRFHVYDTSLRKSNKYLQIDSITGRLVASEISGGAGSSTVALDKITDATDTSTIDNANFKQEWQWNSLTSGTGLKLSSTSTSATTDNTVLEIANSGTIGSVGQTTYGIKIANLKTISAGALTNIGIGINCSNAATIASQVGIKISGTDIAGYKAIDIRNNGRIVFDDGISATTPSYIGNAYGLARTTLLIQASSTSASEVRVRANQQFCVTSLTDVPIISAFIYGGETVFEIAGHFDLSGANYAQLIQKANKLQIKTTTTATGKVSEIYLYTPNENVGIGTATPVASASLEISSTTKGFLPPRMTATQASAISTPAQGLLLFVSDTNGTFTSVGWWGYNGSTWEKLNN